MNHCMGINYQGGMVPRGPPWITKTLLSLGKFQEFRGSSQALKPSPDLSLSETKSLLHICQLSVLFIQQVFVQARIWGRCQAYSAEQDGLGPCPQECIVKWGHKKRNASKACNDSKYNKYFHLWHSFSHLVISMAVSCTYLLLFLWLCTKILLLYIG